MDARDISRRELLIQGSAAHDHQEPHFEAPTHRL
jgi:hypothetical protein